MFPFLRRNTAAEGTGGELVEVENDWVDPAVRAVREVGLDAHRPSISSVKPPHAHTQSHSSLPALGASTPNSTTNTPASPPPTPEMYLARAPRPQKQPGWLSYVFGTTPGHAETSDPEKEVERRTSIGTVEPNVPGTFPIPASKEPREEIVRSARPEAPKPSKSTPAVMPPTNLVLPSTYVKSTAQPQTFASTLASPPNITGTPAYGISSARGTDGLSSAERIRKEWLDAQKEARKAARREERRREREAQRAEQSAESRVQQIIVQQPVIAPTAPATHAQRFIDSQEPTRRPRRTRPRQNPAPSADPTATTNPAPRRHTHTHHARTATTPSVGLLRQASMRRRNVWDDLGPLPLDSSAPPPPTFEASPLSRQVIPESSATDVAGAVDPDDPPPPFPPDADRPRSPPPSFEAAVAQLQINAQIRRAGSVSSASSRGSESGPETEEDERRRQEREAWYRDAAEGLGLEERLRRAFERMKRDDVGLGDEQMGEETRPKHEGEPMDQLEEEMGEQEDAEQQDTERQNAKQDAQEGSTAQSNEQQVEQQHPAPPSEPEADAYVEPEPVSRFSKEEKGKGKATDNRQGVPSVTLLAESPSLAPAVSLAHEVSAAETVARENGERPSRSYLSSPRVRSGGVDKEELASSPTSRSYIAARIQAVGAEQDKTPGSPNSRNYLPSLKAPEAQESVRVSLFSADDRSRLPKVPASTTQPSYGSLSERPLPNLPRPLFNRKPSSGRDSNPWKLLRKMSSAAPSPSVDPSSPPYSPSLVQRQTSSTWTERASLTRTTSNIDERPKSSRRPSALSRMTSQLFKPNLGIESVRTEGSVSEVQDGEKSPAGQMETLSPEFATSPLPHEEIHEAPAVMTYTTATVPELPKPNTPYVAAKHPFNRAVKPAWMQAGPPIWQDSRAVILNGPEPPTLQAPEQNLSTEPPQTTEPDSEPPAEKPRPVPEPPLVHRPVKPRMPPPPIPVRNPLPPKTPVEALPPPKLATQSDHGSSTDSNLTASGGSDGDSDSDSDSSSSSSTTSSAAEIMAKRRVSTYRLLPPRGIPLEVLRSSEPPPPSRHGEHRERARPHGPRTREPPPLPPRPSVHPIEEETAEDVRLGQVDADPVIQATRVVPPSFPPQRPRAETVKPTIASMTLTPQPEPEPVPRPSPARIPSEVEEVESGPRPFLAPMPPKAEEAEIRSIKPAPPIPARKPHVRKPSNGKALPAKAEPVKEPTLQERIMASLLPEAPSRERSLSKDLQDSIRASIVPQTTADVPTARARPAPYKPIGGFTTPQTAPVFQTAQARGKKKPGTNGQPSGKLNIRPRIDDRPELELKSQLAFRVNRWRMKEVPWTQQEIEDELRRMDHQCDDDEPPQPKVERTQSSPEIATKGLDGGKAGSGRIRDPQLRITSTSTADSSNKPSNGSATQTSPSSPKPKTPILEQIVQEPAVRRTAAKEPPTKETAVSAHRRTASLQQAPPVPQTTPAPQRPTVTRTPTVEYTDLDLAAARLEGTSDEFEGIREITSFVSENAKHGATPSELSNLFIAPVEVESRRTTKEGKTKLKLSALGVRVLKCSVCLNQFRSGDIMAMMPKCGHVGHQKCVVEWLKRDARCMVCREPL